MDETRIRARLRRNGKVVSTHTVEILGWHVPGWMSTRCLEHGETSLQMSASKTQADVALASARHCDRVRKLPFAHARDPLQPVLAKQEDGTWARKAGV